MLAVLLVCALGCSMCWQCTHVGVRIMRGVHDERVVRRLTSYPRLGQGAVHVAGTWSFACDFAVCLGTKGDGLHSRHPSGARGRGATLIYHLTLK